MAADNDNLEKRTADVWFEFEDGVCYAWAKPVVGDERYEGTFIAAINAYALKDQERNKMWQRMVFDMVREWMGVAPESLRVQVMDDTIGEPAGRA